MERKEGIPLDYDGPLTRFSRPWVNQAFAKRLKSGKLLILRALVRIRIMYQHPALIFSFLALHQPCLVRNSIGGTGMSIIRVIIFVTLSLIIFSEHTNPFNHLKRAVQTAWMVCWVTWTSVMSLSVLLLAVQKMLPFIRVNLSAVLISQHLPHLSQPLAPLMKQVTYCLKER